MEGVRARRTPLQPHDSQQIDDPHPEPVEHAIFRHSFVTRPVIDGHREYGPSFAQHQRRKESVHMVEIGQIQEERLREQL